VVAHHQRQAQRHQYIVQLRRRATLHGRGKGSNTSGRSRSSVYYSVVPYAVVYKSVSKVIYCADSGEKCITMLGLEAPTREVLRYSSFKKLHKSWEK
jgi:hypothetical protein